MDDRHSRIPSEAIDIDEWEASDEAYQWTTVLRKTIKSANVTQKMISHVIYVKIRRTQDTWTISKVDSDISISQYESEDETTVNGFM